MSIYIYTKCNAWCKSGYMQYNAIPKFMQNGSVACRDSCKMLLKDLKMIHTYGSDMQKANDMQTSTWECMRCINVKDKNIG